MLTTLNILLTYRCSLKCDHCYVFGSPRAKGTFTLGQVRAILEQAAGVGSLEWVYFEGGEPFLRYSLLLQSILRARQMGFKVGVITNGYFGRDLATAERFLAPLRRLGVNRLLVSDDDFHYLPAESNPAKRAIQAARQLGIPVQRVSMEAERGAPEADTERVQLEPRLVHRGRAVEMLAPSHANPGGEGLDRCPLNDIHAPWRAAVDAFGNLSVCQGLCIGNVWETPLAILIERYDREPHPILDPLKQGGPLRLAQTYGFAPVEGHADACHLCFTTRRALLERFPEYLVPRQVYGFV